MSWGLSPHCFKYTFASKCKLNKDLLSKSSIDSSDRQEDKDEDNKWCFLDDDSSEGQDDDGLLSQSIDSVQVQVKCKRESEEDHVEDLLSKSIDSSEEDETSNKDKDTTNMMTTNALSLLTVQERRVSGFKKPRLTNYQRLYLISFLQQHQRKDGVLERGAITKAKTIFVVSCQTIHKLWKRYTSTSDERHLGGGHTRHFSNSGRNKLRFITDDIL